MFNYHSLRDDEFEDLCKDILEKEINTKLRVFSRGKDGGVDLTDDVVDKNTVVQVKHYINSTFASLKGSMKKEIEKIKKIKPKKYYICCGKELTCENIKELYEIFSDFMESDKNIYTLKEIEEFLQKDENSEIVRRHFKLWLHSTDILSQIYNQDKFIDCESLLYDIKKESQLFIQTNSYFECLDYLEKNNTIIMIGAPGVG